MLLLTEKERREQVDVLMGGGVSAERLWLVRKLLEKNQLALQQEDYKFLEEAAHFLSKYGDDDERAEYGALINSGETAAQNENLPEQLAYYQALKRNFELFLAARPAAGPKKTMSITSVVLALFSKKAAPPLVKAVEVCAPKFQ